MKRLAGILLAAWILLPPAAVRAAAGPTDVAGPAQEFTLAALGLADQTVYGANGGLDVYFPRPAAQVADSGSFLRLQYSHSPLLAVPESTMTVLLNGAPLTAVLLGADSSGGAQLTIPLQAATIRTDQVNQLTVRFHLRISTVQCDDTQDRALYATIAGTSGIHYALSGRPGAGTHPLLESYPYPIVDTSAAGPPRIGLVLPSQPDDAELAAAFRLFADLGQRSGGAALLPDAVVAGQDQWLAQTDEPRLVVGRWDRLAAIPALLSGAGFRTDGAGWQAPDGSLAGAADGLLLELPSPPGERRPTLVVTAASDDGLKKAAAALTTPGSVALAGGYAIVRELRSSPPGAGLMATSKPVTLTGLGQTDIAATGIGEHSYSIGFVAPSVDPSDFGYVNLAVSHSSLIDPGTSAVTASVNNVNIGTVGLDRSNEQLTRLQFRFAGQLVHPGLNTLGLQLTNQSTQPCQAPAATDFWSSISATSSLQLPRLRAGSGGAIGLETLPYPFFDAPAGSTTRVVLASGDAPVISAAARVMVALGGRAITQVPDLEAAYAAEVKNPLSPPANLVVVGVPGGPGHLDPLGSNLKVQVGAGTVQLRDTTLDLNGNLSLQGPLGVLQEIALPGEAQDQVLWVDGTDSASLDVAAGALLQGGLAGGVATVDSQGRTRLLGGARPADVLVEGVATQIVKALLLLAGLALVGFLGWQLWQPREHDRERDR